MHITITNIRGNIYPTRSEWRVTLQDMNEAQFAILRASANSRTACSASLRLHETAYPSKDGDAKLPA
jgi:hypothetical protein